MVAPGYEVAIQRSEAAYTSYMDEKCSNIVKCITTLHEEAMIIALDVFYNCKTLGGESLAQPYLDILKDVGILILIVAASYILYLCRKSCHFLILLYVNLQKMDKEFKKYTELQEVKMKTHQENLEREACEVI
jgi:hypothetical protein